MSPKRSILRELGSAHAPIHPSQVPGFTAQPDKYQQAVNELLRDRLIEGHRDDGGRMAIRINEARRHDVERQLRPAWTKVAIWVALLGAIVAAGAGLAV